MPAKVFFDTNVLIYAVAEAIRATFWGERDSPSRAIIAASPITREIYLREPVRFLLN